MIIDCFPFFDELDLLEIRLNELRDVVDVFVLTESPKTFSGLEKPLYYSENKDRFKDHRIVYSMYNDNLNIKPMEREVAQKQFNLDIAYDIYRKGDIIIQGDVDEIPRGSDVRRIAKFEWKSVRLVMDLFYYYMNNKYVGKKRLFRNSRMLRPDDRIIYNADQKDRTDKIKWHGGWHFSYLGDVQTKLEAWGHAEQYNKPPYNTPEHIEKCKKDGIDIAMRKKMKFKFVDDLSYLPKYVKENIDKYTKWIKQ